MLVATFTKALTFSNVKRIKFDECCSSDKDNGIL